jgi:hypothetical protein
MMSEWGRAAAALRVLAAALFSAFNLVPLYGIHTWGWDAFQLLLLYWGETAILFACTLVLLALLPPEARGTMTVNGKTVPASRGLVVGFFAAHGGMFVAGHLLFLCVLFSGDWFGRLNGISDFVHTFLIASGAWRRSCWRRSPARPTSRPANFILASSTRWRSGCMWH